MKTLTTITVMLVILLSGTVQANAVNKELCLGKASLMGMGYSDPDTTLRILLEASRDPSSVYYKNITKNMSFTNAVFNLTNGIYFRKMKAGFVGNKPMTLDQATLLSFTNCMNAAGVLNP